MNVVFHTLDITSLTVHDCAIVPLLEVDARMARLEPITAERVTDSVYRVLREAILNGKFLPGEKLDVDHLARNLNVSRTPVKDAIGSLAAQGLITVEPRKGTFVQRLTARDIAEAFDVREALESLAAEYLAASGTDADFDQLDEHLAHLDASTGATDEHWVLNARFHGAIVDLVGNRRLSDSYRSLQAHLQIARVHRRSAQWHARADAETGEHLLIVQAIQAHDADAAVKAVKAHIRRGKRSLLADLEQLVPDEAIEAAPRY